MGNGGFWRFQPRGPGGRWVDMGVSSLLAAGTISSGAKYHFSNAKASYASAGKVGRFTSLGAGVAVGATLMRAYGAHKGIEPGPWTNVPYLRVSPHSTTVGVNSGGDVNKNYRLSVGGYVRLEHKEETKTEGAIRKVNEATIEALVKKIKPYTGLDKYIRSKLYMVRQRLLNSAAPTASYGKLRAGVRTDKYGSPAMLISYNKRRDNDTYATMRGIAEYNAHMARLQQGKKVKQAMSSRPQRRGRNYDDRRYAA